MGARRISAALALTAMLLPVAGHAAGAAIGTLASGTGALVARDGTVIPAVAGMPLYSGDRVITRTGGRASVKMANSCTLSLGASALLPVSTTACAKPSAVSFDQGRAGYTGATSAFDDDQNHNGQWLAFGAVLGGLGGALYVILRNPNGGHINFPVPVSP